MMQMNVSKSSMGTTLVLVSGYGYYGYYGYYY